MVLGTNRVSTTPHRPRFTEFEIEDPGTWLPQQSMGLDVKPNRVLDEVQCFLLCFPLGIAPLQGRHDCDKVTVLIPFDYTRELVDLHGSAKHANRDTEKVTSYLKRLLRRANAI
jgi:hypothetical protein